MTIGGGYKWKTKMWYGAQCIKKFCEWKQENLK